jgi:hypothetical protein
MSKPVADGSVLGPFSSYLAEYKKLLAAGVALGTAPALTELVLGIGPPWPHRRGIILLTSLVAWVVLLWSFSAWRHTAREFLVSRVTACAILAGASLVVYLLLQAFFVDDAPDSRNQGAMGFLLRPQIQKVLAEEPETTLKDLWKGAEYDPTVVWIPWTVYLVRSGLILLWMVFFGGLSLLASAFLLLQEQLGAARGDQAWGGPGPGRRPARGDAEPAPVPMAAGPSTSVEPAGKPKPGGPQKDPGGGGRENKKRGKRRPKSRQSPDRAK